MAEKTVAQLGAITSFASGDLTVVWPVAGPGPLQKATLGDLKTFFVGTLGTASQADTGTSGHTLPFLDGANTWSAAQMFSMAALAVATIPTASPGDSTTGLASTAFVQNKATPGQLWGLTLSAAGGTGVFGIAAGTAANSTNLSAMALASAYTKGTGGWAVGSGNGSLDTGAIANTTWYHVFLIRRPDTGVVDVLTSLSPTAPTLPANYTQFRRIGSMKTNASAQWLAFSQLGDTFLWDAPTSDIAVTNLGTVATLYTLSVPTGLALSAMFMAFGAASGTFGIQLSSPNTAVQTANTTVGNLSLASLTASDGTAGQFLIRTNTSAQVRAVAAASNTSLRISTQGWIDRRGRDD